MKGTRRLVVTSVAVLLALLLQTTVLPRLGWPDAGLGLVPDLLLLVVVATALTTDPRFATLTGLSAGLLLDLAPPADHLAGRWALAFAVVGYVVGRLSHDHEGGEETRPNWWVALVAVIGGSFLGTSIYALSGVLLRDPSMPFSDLLPVVLMSIALDLVAALVVVPLLFAAHRAVARMGTAPPGRVSPGWGSERAANLRRTVQ
ncbi:rod shape-determining protein MreD [Nocardioides sambongensis]|uniref:rod shape-determining protein MreD n=1 Tax=Nocardioides sambongensis TaxID=2589074 RepID=UPI00112603A3|nr:rod shape-determining protein MreD [Nocardioides sambongensis]